MKKGKRDINCLTMKQHLGPCRVEDIVTIDGRGQMVLPKEVRTRANIRPGDKLTVVSWEKEGKIHCLSLIKSEDFALMLKDVLGPMMKEITAK